jgi:glycosyltransferase involved in cell wall biosynthesis
MEDILAAPIVVIGRNEGERLRLCLAAALRQSDSVVYVDSESIDGSPMLARSLGAEVLELDSPHTPARARHAGFQFLLHRNAGLDAVQFVDSDCELAEGWLALAEAELARRPEVGAVCGRRRERFAGASIFVRLCDLEWDSPTGDVDYFGGDVLIRASAYSMAGGFNPELFTGEDPELAVRVRQKGWTIVRLPAEMTRHDSNMMRFAQWWRRTLRSGYAYAEGSWMHGLEPEHHWLRESLSIWFWGLVLPLSAAGAAFVRPEAALVILAGYPALILKIYVRMRRLGRARGDALLYAAFCVLGKFPMALGQIRFHLGMWSGRRTRRIDYKSA